MTSTFPDFSDLRAAYVNCTVKKSPELSHTQGLMDRSIALMRQLGVTVDTVRLIDYPVATDVYPDMREHGWPQDAWPDEIWPKILNADVLITGNEDGLKHAAMSLRYSLQPIGFVIPPAAHAGGIPAQGNLRKEWDAGERFGFDTNPEYR